MTTGIEKPTPNFMILSLEEHPGKFFMIRQIGEYATHWMDMDGAWRPFPEDDDDSIQLLENLNITGDLPAWDLEGMASFNEEAPEVVEGDA